MTSLKCLLLLLALAVCPLRADPRPACNAQARGRLWPAEAEQDARAAHRLARCGQLLMCTGGLWRYRWQRLTVRVDQLQKGAKAQPPPACAVPPVPQAGGGR